MTADEKSSLQLKEGERRDGRDEEILIRREIEAAVGRKLSKKHEERKAVTYMISNFILFLMMPFF